jgi:alkylhydroperoxidase family enzyme
MALAFLRKLTLEPGAISADDVRPLLAAGISRAAVRDAIYVCYLFNTYDRLADTFGWHIPVQGSFDAGAKMLLKRGYG